MYYILSIYRISTRQKRWGGSIAHLVGDPAVNQYEGEGELGGEAQEGCEIQDTQESEGGHCRYNQRSDREAVNPTVVPGWP